MQTLSVYGIWDTVDKCWMGNDSGPLLYQDELLCRAAMTIMGWRFRQAYRFRKKVFWEDNLRIKDVVTPPLSAVEAMEQNKA